MIAVPAKPPAYPELDDIQLRRCRDAMVRVVEFLDKFGAEALNRRADLCDTMENAASLLLDALPALRRSELTCYRLTGDAFTEYFAAREGESRLIADHLYHAALRNFSLEPIKALPDGVAENEEISTLQGIKIPISQLMEEKSCGAI